MDHELSPEEQAVAEVLAVTSRYAPLENKAWREYVAKRLLAVPDSSNREAHIRADERRLIRAKLLAIAENEYHPMGRMRSLLRDLADQIVPEEPT
jgi:hypothetical protein